MTEYQAHSHSTPAHLATEALWGPWREQLKNCITKAEHLKEWIDLSPAEEEAIRETHGTYRWSVTQYYASLMDRNDENCPIRLQAIPNMKELVEYPGADIDPVGDMTYRKTNRVIHKYPDRVIFLVTGACPVYCRHCTRKYHTTSLGGTYFGDRQGAPMEPDIEYIASHPEIRDVLLTGGDPLMLSDEKLEPILKALRAIPHVEIIRIGSRFPVLMPSRITPAFCRMLESVHPVWLNTHFNHPKEITAEAAAACDMLLRHGIPVQNQSVLLKGVNDSPEIMKELVHKLLKIRVRPYYLYHCDNVQGVSHFMTSIEEGRDITEKLAGYTTGFALPSYVLTTDLGKIPVTRQYVHDDEQGNIWVENYESKKKNLGKQPTPSSERFKK